MKSLEKPTIGLIHGAWHGAWCWRFTQTELEKLGHNSIAVDLPIDDPNKDFEDYADVVAQSLADEKEVVLVGHSRGGNVIPRVAGRIAVRKLIYLCASFDEATLRPTRGYITGEVPNRFTDLFWQGVKSTSGEMTEYDPGLAKPVFYGDCDDILADWAVKQLRPQRRAKEEAVMEQWPNAPAEYIICDNDMVRAPGYAEFVAQQVLNVDPVFIQGDHSPFLSRPTFLARTLSSMAD